MIKREIFKKIVKVIDDKEIILITGPRQAGKTTLMLWLKEYLEKKGKKTVFFNLDIERDVQFFKSQEIFIEEIKNYFGSNFGYVFIDEIQRKENAGLFLKGIYDMNLPIKLIVSGSGSLELKEKIHESLTGRKIVFHLNPLFFKEFVNYKTNYLYETKLEWFFSVDKIRAESLFKEYLSFGGYPRVVLADDLEKKRLIINEIFQSYLERDIVYLLKVEKSEVFINLVKILASQVGQILNFSELSSTLGISLNALKKYLWYLEKTFVIRKITPFYTNIRKELTKSPICYFVDLGLKNFALNDFFLKNIISSGFYFQNFIFQLIEEKTANDSSLRLNFWRTKDKAEVDFILVKSNNPIPIEVKFKSLKKPEISRSFLSFIKKYQPKIGLLINLDYEKRLKINETEVFIMPYWKFLQLKF